MRCSRSEWTGNIGSGFGRRGGVTQARHDALLKGWKVIAAGVLCGAVAARGFFGPSSASTVTIHEPDLSKFRLAHESLPVGDSIEGAVQSPTLLPSASDTQITGEDACDDAGLGGRAEGVFGRCSAPVPVLRGPTRALGEVDFDHRCGFGYFFAQRPVLSRRGRIPDEQENGKGEHKNSGGIAISSSGTKTEPHGRFPTPEPTPCVLV